MKRIIVASVLFAASAVSCTDSSESEPRTSSEVSEVTQVTPACGCDLLTADVWPGPQAELWPANAKGMVYVISGSSEPGEFLAFGFVNQGYNVAWIYKAPLSQYAQFIGAVNGQFAAHVVQPATNSALPDVWAGGGGSLDTQPTGPGIPRGYLARMQRTAASIIEALQAEQHANGVGNVVYGE